MSVFFTADSHFNHQAMVERGWRPQYSTVAEMNEDLIERWNASVRPDDVVWHLGDYALGNTLQSLALVKRLNGTKHLITGNHDKCWPALRDSAKWQGAFLEAGFASVQAFARRRILGQSVLLSHFPYSGDHVEVDRFTDYRLPDSGLWLIHGHVHDAWRVNGRMINVGVDVHDFRPVPLDAIEGIMNEEIVESASE